MRTNVDRLSVDELRQSREAWWTAEFTEFLCAAFAAVGPARILDVGCGIGTLAQRLGPRLPAGSHITGIDVDLARLKVAAATGAGSPSVPASYVAADAAAMPFRAASFDVAVVMLTLEHVEDPARVLTEMRRVTRAGGVVVAVEADNGGQRLHLPRASADLDAAVAAYWGRIQAACRPRDISIGPRLPALFSQAGLASPSVRGYLLSHTTWMEAPAFVAHARTRFGQVARTYGIAESKECRTLLQTIESVALGSPKPFYAISTVPLFLTVAQVDVVE